MSASAPPSPPSPGDVQVSFSSELMKNYAPELPVDATHQLEALQAGDVPWVFSVGSDDVLYAVTRRDGRGTGWVQHPLSAGLGTVTAFGAAAGADGRFRLALGATAGGVSRVYLGPPTDFTRLELEAFDPAAFWTAHDLPDPAARVDQVRVDADGALFATSRAGADARYYTLDDAGVKPYTLPENGSTVLALSLGTVYGDRGVFLLYEVGGARTMLFQAFPDPRFGGKTVKYRFDPGGTVHDFTLLRGDDGNDSLLTAGDAVHLFATPDTEVATVAAPAAGLRFLEVRAAQRDGVATLWLLGAKGGAQSLYYLTNHFYDGTTGTFTTRWTAPLPLRGEVGRFAPLRGGEVSNHLFFVGQKNELVHFWQDAATTLWQGSAVPVHDTGSARELDSYTVHVQFTPSALRSSVAGLPVTVTSSAAAYLTMNGIGYQVGPNTPARVPLDATGTLNIVSPTSSLAAPTLTLAADFLPTPRSVPLMHNVQKTLDGVKRGSDLKGATRYDPATNTRVPLLATEPSDDTLDAVAGAVEKLAAAAAKMEAPPPPARRAALRSAAALARTASGTRAGPVFALAFPAEGGVVLHQGEAARAHPAARAAGVRAESVEGGLGHAFGDFIHWLREIADRVVRFVVEMVEDVVSFTIHLAEAVYHFVVTTAHEVFAGIEWLFSKIRVSLKELVEWLGFLFAWPDILATKDALVQLFTGGLDAFAGTARRIRREFDAWAEDVIANQLHSPELADRLRASAGQTLDGLSERAGGAGRGQPDPRVHWAATQLPHLAAADVPTRGGGEGPGGVMEAVLAGLQQMVGDFALEYHKVSDQADDWFQGRITTAEFALAVLEAVGALALDIVQRLVDGILEAAAALAEVVKTALLAPLDVPFLSALYRERISDAPLSILDVTCLVAAIPATIAYKLAVEKAPFGAGAGDQVLAAPKSFFESFTLAGAAPDAGSRADAVRVDAAVETDGAAGSLAPDAAPPPPGGAVPYAIIGSVRLLRSVTMLMLTTAATTPLDDEDAVPGTGGLLVADHLLRVFGSYAALVTGRVDALKGASAFYFSLAAIVSGGMYARQRLSGSPESWSIDTPESLAGRLGKTFNAGAFIDSACVTSIGIWGAVVTSETWDEKIDALRAAEVLNEIFQIPAIVGFLANSAARGSQDADAKLFAGAVAAVRLAGMLGSSISEMVTAAKAA